jgi:dTDP-4-amino-4,6-dideoxygalactose transaminase
VTKNIPQTDPKAAYLARKNEIDAAISRSLSSGWFILGQETGAFEREFAAFIGADHAVGVGNGTDALVVALRACGIVAGDAVITVAHTAVATVAAIELAGAVPILADIDPETFTISASSLEGTIAGYLARPKSLRHPIKAVIAVHLYGHPADLPAIGELARRHNLVLIEDCAQSHGATLNGRTTGTWGHAAAFSFYPTKNLGALGDGGTVVTSDPRVAENARLLREYGWKERYVSQITGMNTRLDEIQSAILRAKLPVLDADNARRQAIAAQYSRELRDTRLTLPPTRPGASHVFHQFVIRSRKRDELRMWLRERGVGTLVHYPVPVHRQPAYAGRVWTLSGGLPHTDAAAASVLSLPMFPQLSDDDVATVAALLREWSANNEP